MGDCYLVLHSNFGALPRSNVEDIIRPSESDNRDKNFLPENSHSLGIVVGRFSAK